MGIFGPELVVFAAWRQYISAKALLTEVKKETRLRRPDGSLVVCRILHDFCTKSDVLLELRKQTGVNVKIF